MEAKILSSIKKQLARDPKKLTIENYHLVRLSEALQSALAACADSLTNLSLAGCKLNTVSNLPPMPRLRALNLNDNNLKDDDLLVFRDNRHLKYLYLAGNRIATVGAIEKLNGNLQLKMIDVFGCPVAKTGGYRDALFKMFPNLQLIDYTTADDEEISYVQSEDTESEDEEAEGADEGDLIDDTEVVADENAAGNDSAPQADLLNSQGVRSKGKIEDATEVGESEENDSDEDDEEKSAESDESVDKHPDDDGEEDDEAGKPLDRVRSIKRVRTNDHN